MNKVRIYTRVLLHLAPQILGLEVLFLGFCWLLHRYWSLLQRFSFVDVLFIMGALACLTGSAGMLRSPYYAALSPAGIWANQVQPTEEEKRVQRVEELIHQASFGLRILAVGVITLLASIALTYIK